MESEAAIRGVTHISLSVRDLDQSFDFYHRVLGLPILVPPFEGEVFAGREVMLLVGRAALCLQEHSTNEGDLFDPTRTGLDHFAFMVSSLDALERWSLHLDDAGVEHSEIKAAGSFGSMIELRDPDGVQLEIHTLEAAESG